MAEAHSPLEQFLIKRIVEICVGGEDTDGVHGALVQTGPRQFLLFQMWHENRAPLCADGRGLVSPAGAQFGARCGTYQPFTIETLIYHSAAFASAHLQESAGRYIQH